jgi:hypothetical protein
MVGRLATTASFEHQYLQEAEQVGQIDEASVRKQKMFMLGILSGYGFDYRVHCIIL